LNPVRVGELGIWARSKRAGIEASQSVFCRKPVKIQGKLQ
jgi:hypothetical protein